MPGALAPTGTKPHSRQPIQATVVAAQRSRLTLSIEPDKGNGLPLETLMDVTITGGSVCSGGEHRIVQTDLGNVSLLNSELASRPEGFAELKEAFIIVVRHQYLSRRAAGRTHAQALSDLVGFVVRL